MIAIKRSSYLLIASGALVALSAVLPWVTGLGIISAGLPSQAVLVVVIIGVVLASLGATGLNGRAKAGALVALWILAVVDSAAVFVLFKALQADSGLVGDLVKPAAGFWCALIGLIFSIVGTIALQVNRGRAGRVASLSAGVAYGPWGVAAGAVGGYPARAPATVAGVDYRWSEDGQYWWDGRVWVPSATSDARPNTAATPISADGQYWWNDREWVPHAGPAQPAIVNSAAVPAALIVADPAAPRSADGYYWWDGQAWLPV